MSEDENEGTFIDADRITDTAWTRMRLEPAGFTVGIAINNVPLATGVLVQIDDRYGILTAEHVANHPDSRELSLVRAGSSAALGVNVAGLSHRIIFPASLLSVFNPRRENDEHGPDIAFIQLPSTGPIGEISARKLFYNLTKESAIRMAEGASEKGAHIVLGCPDALIETREGEAQFEITHRQNGATLVTKPGSYKIAPSGWDYITAHFTKSKIPFSGAKLGGMSGSGMWKTRFKRLPDGAVEVDHIILCGIVFHDSRPGDNDGEEIVLTAHGPISIYERIVAMVRHD